VPEGGANGVPNFRCIPRRRHEMRFFLVKTGSADGFFSIFGPCHRRISRVNFTICANEFTVLAKSIHYDGEFHSQWW
jgi:hypothetical protein